MLIELIPEETLEQIALLPFDKRARAYEKEISTLSRKLETHYQQHGWPTEPELHLPDLQLFRLYELAIDTYRQLETSLDIDRLRTIRQFELDARNLTMDKVMQYLNGQEIDKEKPFWLKI